MMLNRKYSPLLHCQLSRCHQRSSFMSRYCQVSRMICRMNQYKWLNNKSFSNHFIRLYLSLKLKMLQIDSIMLSMVDTLEMTLGQMQTKLMETVQTKLCTPSIWVIFSLSQKTWKNLTWTQSTRYSYKTNYERIQYNLSRQICIMKDCRHAHFALRNLTRQ